MIWRRYKEINKMLKSLPKVPGTPELPPKHIVGNLDPTTVQERVDGFNKVSFPLVNLIQTFHEKHLSHSLFFSENTQIICIYSFLVL